MAKKQLIKKQKKGAKKSFHEVSAPITATKIHLYSTSPEELDGKMIKLDLTKSLRGKNLELKLRIRAKNNKLEAEPEKAELANTYIRKATRRGTDYVEDSFKVECRDTRGRIKPFLITRKRVSRSVLKALREETKKHLLTHLKTRTANEIFQEIMTNKLQKQLSLKLKKIYPLAFCEIRVFEILEAKELENKKEEK